MTGKVNWSDFPENSDEGDRQPLIDWMNKNFDALSDDLEHESWLNNSDPDRVAERKAREEELTSFNKSWQNWAEQNNIDPYPPVEGTDRRRGRF